MILAGFCFMTGAILALMLLVIVLVVVGIIEAIIDIIRYKREEKICKGDVK